MLISSIVDVLIFTLVGWGICAALSLFEKGEQSENLLPAATVALAILGVSWGLYLLSPDIPGRLFMARGSPGWGIRIGVATVFTWFFYVNAFVAFDYAVGRVRGASFGWMVLAGFLIAIVGNLVELGATLGFLIAGVR